MSGKDLEPSEKIELQRTAAQMKMEGNTYTQIAQTLGISPQTASNWVGKHIDRITQPDQIEQLRDELNSQYEAIIGKYWSKMDKQESAAYLVMRAMKARGDLYGATAPKRIDMRVQEMDSKDTEKIDEELARFYEMINQREQEALQDDIVEGEIIDPEL